MFMVLWSVVDSDYLFVLLCFTRTCNPCFLCIFPNLCIHLNEIRTWWVEWLWNRRVEYWAISSSVRSFARTAHSFARSALLAFYSFARSLTHAGAQGKDIYVYKLNASISYSFNPLRRMAMNPSLHLSYQPQNEQNDLKTAEIVIFTTTKALSLSQTLSAQAPSPSLSLDMLTSHHKWYVVVLWICEWFHSVIIR